MSVLLIDIGNSRLKWRVTDLVGDLDDVDGFVELDRIDRLPEDWRALAMRRVETLFISNVANERLALSVEQVARETWPSIALHRVTSQRERCGVVNRYRDLTQLGPDRWLALIGAHHRRPATSLLVCSFGTATTIDLLVDEGDRVAFVGGLIVPGFETMGASLESGTARLSNVRGDVVDFADRTSDAITSGVMWAQVGAVERAWHHATSRLSGNGRGLSCMLAGGHASSIAPHLTALGSNLSIVHDLVLRGLAVVARDPLAVCESTRSTALPNC